MPHISTGHSTIQCLNRGRITDTPGMAFPHTGETITIHLAMATTKSTQSSGMGSMGKISGFFSHREWKTTKTARKMD
jgi:hypothetical protein